LIPHCFFTDRDGVISIMISLLTNPSDVLSFYFLEETRPPRRTLVPFGPFCLFLKVTDLASVRLVFDLAVGRSVVSASIPLPYAPFENGREICNLPDAGPFFLSTFAGDC